MKQSPKSRRLQRMGLLCVLLAPVAAAAHGLPQFTIDAPVGANNPADGGFAELRWTDYGVWGFLDLYAYPSALRPLSYLEFPPAGGLRLPGRPEAHAPENTYAWDVSQLAPGCYQPVIHFEEFGDYYLFVANGRIVVSSDAGVHPSVFITTPRAAWTNNDGGPLLLTVETAEPDDTSTLSLRYERWETLGTGQAIGAPRVLPPGNHVETALLDTSALEPGTYALHAELQSEDGERCATYWPYPLTLLPRPDAGAGQDGGADAGEPARDAGSHVELGEQEDAGRPRIRVLPPPVADPGCGATGLGPLLLVTALAPLLRFVRRRR